MKEHRKGNGLEGFEDFMMSARKGIVYSFGGVLVLAIVASIGLRQSSHSALEPAIPPIAAAPEMADQKQATHHMPRTFHEMERPHPLHLLTPEPLLQVSAP